MNPMAKMLMVAGAVMLIAGLWVQYGPRVPWLGRLPGDIRIEGRNGGGFYFPVVTCIIISIILSVIFNLFKGR